MNEFYFSRTGQFPNTTIMVAYFRDGGWSDPVPVSFTNTDFRDLEPHLTPDGKSLFFDSTRPKPGSSSPNNWGMWVTERPDPESPWGTPEYFGQGMFLTTAKSGNLYYTDISTYRQSKGISVRTPINDGYSAPIPLPQEVNRYFAAHPVIAPDESFIIFDAFYPDGQGKGKMPDYYISFQEKNGGWSEAVNLGAAMKGIIPQGKPWTRGHTSGPIPPQGTGYGSLRPLALSRKWNQLVGSASLARLRINGPLHNNCASISPNGTIFFYTYEGDIFWLDADILQKHR